MILLLLFPILLMGQPVCYYQTVENNYIEEFDCSLKFIFEDKYVYIQTDSFEYQFKIKHKKKFEDKSVYRINNYTLYKYNNKIIQKFSRRKHNIYFFCND
tara:strand:+ start:6164 stop:6463 length:300 start_codon:yes stop_codon:yes gene_type:complete